MRLLTVLIVIIAMFVSACGSKPAGGEKIAVVDWDKVLEAHPKQVLLKKQKDDFDSLLQKREEQANVGKTQLAALSRLQQLKQNSKQNFAAADFSTKISEKEAVEREQLKAEYNKAVAAANTATAADEAKLEEAYRLKILNLRLRLESVKMSAPEREATLKELGGVQAEREQARAAMQNRKNAMVNGTMQPLVEAMHARMDAYAEELRSSLQSEIAAQAQQDSVNLGQAPAALSDALAAVDKELDARQQSVEALQKSIRQDIESLVMKAAHEKGYTIVFHKVKANVKADDITEEVINQLKSKSN